MIIEIILKSRSPTAIFRKLQKIFGIEPSSLAKTEKKNIVLKKVVKYPLIKENLNTNFIH